MAKKVKPAIEETLKEIITNPEEKIQTPSVSLTAVSSLPRVGVKCEDPKYTLKKGSARASAYDLRAKLSNTLYLDSGSRVLIKTGIFLELPTGYEALVMPRSGNALKKGLTVLNTPGLIDEDYRGEIGVILINLGLEEVEINDGDAIAQLKIQKCDQVELFDVSEVKETERGAKGFGSSGLVGE